MEGDLWREGDLAGVLAQKSPKFIWGGEGGGAPPPKQKKTNALDEKMADGLRPSKKTRA